MSDEEDQERNKRVAVGCLTAFGVGVVGVLVTALVAVGLVWYVCAAK